MPVLQDAFQERVRMERALEPKRPLLVGGKSLGGRVASLLDDALAFEEGVRDCLCLGYPFYPPSRPPR
jgi:predicted alpha/beta-hydrolase family hydrolase